MKCVGRRMGEGRNGGAVGVIGHYGWKKVVMTVWVDGVNCTMVEVRGQRGKLCVSLKEEDPVWSCWRVDFLRFFSEDESSFCSPPIY